MPYAKLLSSVSSDQALKLKELEKEYEEVLDENCRVLAVYFKEVLVNKDEDSTISPPLLILKNAAGSGSNDRGGLHRKEEMKMPQLENGRYNVMLSLMLFVYEFILFFNSTYKCLCLLC